MTTKKHTLSEYNRILEEIRFVQEEIKNEKVKKTDEQKIDYILSCVGTHTPEQLLKMIITLEDDKKVDNIIYHPTFPRDLFIQIEAIATEWAEPMKDERKRVQEETKRVQEEIKRADILIENLRNDRKIVQDLNRVMEGQIGMYRELNSDLKVINK
jgi:uncharacterized alpha-E superfamily protein